MPEKEANMPLLMPPTLVSIPDNVPYLFLIGPIQGAPDWQNPTAKWFLDRLPQMYVASPRSSMWERDLPEEEKKRLFDEQALWERINIDEALMRIASLGGCFPGTAILAWCAAEEVHDPSRAYAQTTRHEIGKILGWLNGRYCRNAFLNPAAKMRVSDGVFVGADKRYSGRRYLEGDLNNSGRILYDSLEVMREQVLAYLQGKPAY